MTNLFQLVKKTFFNQLSKPLFKDTSWLMSAEILGTLIQVIYFILVARSLGASSYGIFEGVKSIWAIVFPFIGLGMSDVLIQNASREKELFSKYWGYALLVVFITIGIAIAIIFPLSIALFPEVTPLFIFLVLLADIVGLKLCSLAGSAFISAQRMREASQYGLLYTLCKLITAAFLPLFPEEQRLLAWGFLYALGSLLPAVLLLIIVGNKLGQPSISLNSFEFNQLKQGFFFSVGASAENINFQVDRAMVLSLASPAASGIYSAGYRFIDMGFKPIFAIQTASYPRFFRHGESGINGTVNYAKKLFPVILSYGLLSSITLIIFSPFVPLILGKEFGESSSILLWLAPIHLMYGIQYLVADSLTGAGFQRSRSLVQSGAAALNIGLNFILIPIYSWKGAIWATLSSESFKLFFLLGLASFIYFKEAKANTSAENIN